MTPDLSPTELGFREEVRRFIADHYPPAHRHKQRAGDPLTKADHLVWRRILAARGWAAPEWPLEHGGAGWTPLQARIWSDELARANIPAPPNVGVDMVGPMICALGDEQQMARFLAPTRMGDFWWCLALSEPAAGSDLAAIAAIAAREGEHYRVCGHKTWIAQAQFADWGVFLVRTGAGAPDRAGLSVLLIDLRSPGVSVRPIRSIGGLDELCDVILEDVLVPVGARVGDEGQGLAVVRLLRAHDRLGQFSIARCRLGMERLRTMAAGAPGDDAAPLMEDAFFRRKMSELEIDLIALEVTEFRGLAGAATEVHAALLKIMGAELRQRLEELALEAAGHYGLMLAPSGRGLGHNFSPTGSEAARAAAPDYYEGRGASIEGGSSEMQRNIIAGMLLDL